MAFYGKVALVTGGASGMGRITVRQLTKQGAQVAVLDMNEAALAELAAENSRIHPFKCDVSDNADVARVVEAVESTVGPIDRVVHCAAIMPNHRLLDMAPEAVMRLMNINYGGTVNIVLNTLPRLLARRSGDLVVYGSLAGYVPATNIGAYNASKAATVAFMEVLMRENANQGVRMLLVNPPAVNTPLIQQALDTAGPKNLRDAHAKGRLADPDFIVSETEKALEKGTQILFPGAEAKILSIWRRIAPGLLWKAIDKSNQ